MCTSRECRDSLFFQPSCGTFKACIIDWYRMLASDSLHVAGTSSVTAPPSDVWESLHFAVLERVSPLRRNKPASEIMHQFPGF